MNSIIERIGRHPDCNYIVVFNTYIDAHNFLNKLVTHCISATGINSPNLEAFRQGQVRVALLVKDYDLSGLELGPYSAGRSIFVIACGVIENFSKIKERILARIRPPHRHKDEIHGLNDTFKFPDWMGSSPRKNTPWTVDETKRLLIRWEHGATAAVIAAEHGREESDVLSQLRTIYKFRGSNCPTCGRLR